MSVNAATSPAASTSYNRAITRESISGLTATERLLQIPSTTARLSGEAEQIQQLSTDLQAWAQQDPAGFRTALDQAFGDKADAATLDALVEQATRGELSLPNQIEFVDAGSLGENAFGAYDANNGGTIYLDRRLLSNPQQLQSVFREEMGHHLDALLGGADAAGDEGAIFARASLHGPLDQSTLSQLKAENDHGTIFINGQIINVEFNEDGGDSGDAGDTSADDGGGTDTDSTDNDSSSDTDSSPSNASDNTATLQMDLGVVTQNNRRV